MSKLRRVFRKSTSLLRGDDGRLSFAKVVLLVLLGGWLAGRELGAALAFVFVGASYGWKWVRLYTNNGGAPRD